MNMRLIKIIVLMGLAFLLTACGLSTFTQRETDPYIRDVFFNQTQKVAITVTDSSRRLVYEVEKYPSKKIICADASPDTSIAASGAIGGELSMSNAEASGALKGHRNSATATMPLVRRSQGLQWGRDNAALECMLYAMGITNEATYLKRLDKVREDAKSIIYEEIKMGLGNLQIGQPVEAQGQSPLAEPSQPVSSPHTGK
jgi:thioredoxin reductase